MPIKKRVLIVDDSALIRQILTDIINSLSDFEVCGTAPDPHVAAEKIVSLKPDVMTLDIEMPKMDGLTFLEKIMRLRPLPVLIFSSLVGNGSTVGLKALELGAIDYIAKPTKKITDSIAELKVQIEEKLKAAVSSAKKIKNPTTTRAELDKKYNSETQIQKKEHLTFQTTDKVIAIGASTGGPVALSYIFARLNANIPGIVVVIHMPPGFTKSFAERLNRESKLTVKEAVSNDTILPGMVLVAEGNRHLLVKRSGARYYVEIDDGPHVNRHRPSVDVLFRSTAQNIGPNAIGVILTGMGDDGALGMREMKESGSFNIAQDESTSLIYGMPKVAVERGGVDKQLTLDEIVEYLNSLKIT